MSPNLAARPKVAAAAPSAARSAPEDREPGRLARLASNQQFVLLIALAAVMIFFTAKQSAFISRGEFGNLFTDFSTLILLAVGETFVIIAGGIDLSVGSTATISTILGAKVMVSMTHSAEPIVLIVGLLVCIGVGAAVGLINAALINFAKLVPFVATLATLGAGAGLALVFSGGGPIGADSKAIAFTVPHIWAFSWPDLMIFAIIATAWAYLHKGRFGRYTFAVGSNAFAARAAGINVRRHTMKVYLLSGVLAGLTGMFFYLRLGSGAPTSGSGEELQAIAAVVIGGVALTGGVGRLSGTILGAMILTVVTDGLVVINVNPNWNQVAVAGLIAAAATLQALRPKRGQA